jgi:hypothetical protein
LLTAPKRVIHSRLHYQQASTLGQNIIRDEAFGVYKIQQTGLIATTQDIFQRIIISNKIKNA